MRHHDRRTTRARRLRVELLESRQMLAGNVSASRSGDTLFIRGDNAANEVAVFSTGGSTYTVAGLDTTVNGDDERTFSGIRNLNIDLRGGDDVLSIADDPTGFLDLATAVDGGVPIDLATIGDTSQTDLAGFVLVRTGGGNDTVALSVDAGSFVDIATGGGNDDVGVLRSDVGLHLFVRGDDGADRLAVVDSFAETTLLIEGGRGADQVLVQTYDGGTMIVNGGRDADFLALFDLAIDNAIVVNGEHGNDVINLEFSEANFIHVLGGDGGDEIDVDGVDSFGDLIVTAGSGNDDVEVEPNDEYVEEGNAITRVRGALVIDGGSGHDSLEAELVEARFLTILGGGGDDELDADGVNIENFIILNAGAGNDEVDLGQSDDDEFDPGLDSAAGGFVHILLGGGADEAFVQNTSIGQHLLLDGGEGNDLVEADGIDAVDFVLFLLGTGNDDLNFFDVNGSREELDGGPGFDELFIDTRNGRRIRNFERVVVGPVEPLVA